MSSEREQFEAEWDCDDVQECVDWAGGYLPVLKELCWKFYEGGLHAPRSQAEQHLPRSKTDA